MKTTIRSNNEEIRQNDKETVLKYQTVYKNFSRQFSVTTLKDKSSFYFLVKVPSSSFKKNALAYDVIIEVINAKGSGDNIFDKPIRVFSNSPSFVFTYAYVFNKHGLLIPWLKNKYSKKILDNVPVSRNPKQELELDQSLKVALLHLGTVYKYGTMDTSSRHAKRLFKNEIDQTKIYRSVSTALQKTDENKKVKQETKKREGRNKRILSTLKNPTNVFKSSSSGYSSSGGSKKSSVNKVSNINKISKKTARQSTRKK